MKSAAFSTSQLTLTGVMTAAMCILGPIVIPLPFSPVPISFTNLAVCITVYALGMRYGTISYLIYLLIGMTGIPVFSGFSGGLGKLAGPTGGYLIGFIFLALISGFFIDHFAGKVFPAAAGMILGTAVCYLFGTLWLCHQASLSFTAGLWAGVVPYLPGDAAKIILASMAGPPLRRGVADLQK